MASFSVNQVRQMYVAGPTSPVKENLAALATPGDICVGNTDGHIYFQYVGALGDIMRSDLIKATSIKYAKGTPADALAYKLKKYTVVLDSTVNGGAIINGQDYLLRLAFREYVGISPEKMYFKYGMVHGYTGMDASTFYKKMAISLAKNLSNTVNPIASIFVTISSSEKAVTATTTEDDLAGSATNIVIYEAAQPWHLGIMPQGVIPFEVQPTAILVDGNNRIWGTVTKAESKTALPQGQKVADLEWFAMGERADQIRLVGWPNIIPTKYMVDPSKEYDILNIHYFYTGDNEVVQKSEKDIQIACVHDENFTIINALADKIDAAIVAAGGDITVDVTKVTKS